MMGDINFALGIGAAATLVQSLLLLTIFRKAGFGLLPSLAGLLPLAALVATYALMLPGIANASETALLSALLTLMPFLILAFNSWPQATRNSTSPETFS